MQTEYKVLDHGYVRHVDHMGTDAMPLEAARMSTGNPTGVDPAKDEATRDYLYRHDHATPFEMAVLQVEIQAPIFVVREIQRHRTFSFNEFSGRYAEMPALYYVPTIERIESAGQSATNKQGSERLAQMPLPLDLVRESFRGEQEYDYAHYKRRLDDGMARELARINLPLAQYTRFRMQGVLRNWLHFLDLRLRDNVQPECRAYAEAIAAIIKDLWPLTYDRFEEHTLHAARYSRTENDIIRETLSDYSEDSGANLAAHMIRMARERLAPGPRREFLAKLGLDK